MPRLDLVSPVAADLSSASWSKDSSPRTALLVGRQINAPLIYAETARNSAAWWGKFLFAGDNLIKVDDVDATWRRLHEFLEKDGKVTIVNHV